MSHARISHNENNNLEKLLEQYTENQDYTEIEKYFDQDADADMTRIIAFPNAGLESLVKVKFPQAKSV